MANPGRKPRETEQGQLQHGLRYKLSEMANHLLLKATEAHPQFNDPQEHLNFIIYTLFGAGQAVKTYYSQSTELLQVEEKRHLTYEPEEDTQPRDPGVMDLGAL